MDVQFIHHGAREGVTGSCHELKFPHGRSLIVDIGLFQGAETSGSSHHNRGSANHQEVDFPINHIDALVITHCHIDHVGRLPWLLMAGFRKPIYCTQATAHLLPMVIEDALKVGLTRDRGLIEGVLGVIERLLVPVEFDVWQRIDALDVSIRFRQAGHILGSAFVEVGIGSTSMPTSGTGFSLSQESDKRGQAEASPRVVFSGDLGCKNSPLLPDPAPLERADVLVLESTYGDKNHENRAERQERLQSVVEKCMRDRGTVLIPAFSIGRTQELLYELEDILFHERQNNPDWKDILVILDSPMAAKFTEKYKVMKSLWDQESKHRVSVNRHPLDFERLHVIDSHDEHQRIVHYLQQSGDPCIVIAASGMCTGGRMLNYLKALLPDSRTDVLFVGYQAQGTPGRDIQKYGPRCGYVELDHEKVWIKAGIHTLGGYSAHADQQELIEFVQTAEHIGQIRLVHGDSGAKSALAEKLRESGYEVCIP
ncbi:MULTISPECIES: MBL fold metallo-hydrolase RNA specificity domain-containing protein [Gammaproteobacteria]|uniref:MBL fold metallo-hydrolase RNA specificity domain-containing protein n=1 Tax=Gammaproteobacteria TaxID=1236 RepID=UPI000DD04BB1|nr:MULTISPECIES: MBL fold metallo-hydrolase [Gammaproteobacteria]RTE86076.1 MBL fold metallo-hydrolase [Aliidiomarina sp. B3213]TCZ91430.1 MBL fold metallo-hydrolase [Lysobacter sp. N42]